MFREREGSGAEVGTQKKKHFSDEEIALCLLAGGVKCVTRVDRV